MNGRGILCVLAGSAVAVAGTVLPAHATAGTPSLIVRTDAGAVYGKQAGGVDSFLGVRYGAAPVGALRWRPPQRPKPWSGVRQATSYGNRCPVLVSTNGARSVTEDCLFVNVRRPTGTGPGAHLPVYVFIHGGGLVNGSSSQSSGAKIVREAGAIFVSMNYRLGVFGFLGLPGLADSPGDGNYGLLDQQAALRWVQRNIAAFGGDRTRVTVGGESAGGWSVCAHLVSRWSRGLFSQALMQSGSCFSRSQRRTHEVSAAYAASVGCPDAATAVRCLRRQPVARLLDASATFAPALTSGTAVLPVPPRLAVAQGHFARVPILIGANRDEGRTFTQGNVGWSRARYVAWVRDTFGTAADGVLARYPWPSRSDRWTGAYLTGAVTTDAGLVLGIGGCANLQLTNALARRTRTYAYEFDARHGPGLTPLPGYVWGAAHAAELAYLFPSFDNGTPIAPTFDRGERQLARDMVQYWGTFVLRSHPSATGSAAWPRYDTTHRILSLRVAGRSTTISEAAYRAEHRCDFWDSLPAS